MIGKTALLLVLVFTVGSVRVLTCELACAGAAANHQDTVCHEDSEAATTLVNGAAHQCDYDTIALSLTAPQKTTALEQRAAVFVDLRAGGPLPSTTRDEFLALPLGTPPDSLSARTPVLRI